MRYILVVLMGVAAVAAAIWMVAGGAPPTPQNVALFLVLLIPAITGLFAPILALVHRRLPLGGQPPTMKAAVRQAFLVGVALAVAGWLQLNRLLDATLVVGIVACVILAEWLVQSRAR